MKKLKEERKEPTIDDIRDAILQVYPESYHGERWAKIYDEESRIRRLVSAVLTLNNFKDDIDVYVTIVKMNDHCVTYL